MVSGRKKQISHDRFDASIYRVTEIVREYGGMDAAGGFSNYPTMSSRYGDFARDAHHQQASSAYSQRRNMHDYNCCLALLFFISLHDIDCSRFDYDHSSTCFLRFV